MDVVLYTTGCPKCRVLETKLKQKNIDFKIVDDQELMIQKGFMEAPILEVGGKIMNFGEAVKWVNSFMGE